MDYSMMNKDDVIAMITVLRQQERSSAYQAVDPSFYDVPRVVPQRGFFSSLLSAAGATAPDESQQQVVDVSCRSLMSQWCYQVSDYCKFRRETVAIAMSYVDRFVSASANKNSHDSSIQIMNKSYFQMLAMTSLYTAIKVHESEAMDPKLVSTLSRGAYTEDDITSLERELLITLEWKMHPPTAAAFVRLFMPLLAIPQHRQQDQDHLYELAIFQTELAVSDGYFIGTSASMIALAAICNALYMIDGNNNNYDDFDDESHVFCQTICQVAQMDYNGQLFLDIQDRLYMAAKACDAAKTIMATTTSRVEEEEKRTNDDDDMTHEDQHQQQSMTAMKDNSESSPRSTTTVGVMLSL